MKDSHSLVILRCILEELELEKTRSKLSMKELEEAGLDGFILRDFESINVRPRHKGRSWKSSRSERQCNTSSAPNGRDFIAGLSQVLGFQGIVSRRFGLIWPLGMDVLRWILVLRLICTGQQLCELQQRISEQEKEIQRLSASDFSRIELDFPVSWGYAVIIVIY